MVILQQTRPNQLMITLPQALAKAKDWNKGKKLRWIISGEGLMLVEEK